MKKNTLLLFLLFGAVLPIIAQRKAAPYSTTAKIDLLSPFYTFATTASPQSTINKSHAKAELRAGKRDDGFTIKLKARLLPSSNDHLLLEIPDLVQLILKQTDPNHRDKQNYPASIMPDGTVPVVEATITLTSPHEKIFSRDMTIGFPLAAIDNPADEHEIILTFSGTAFTIYADGQVMDNDFAIGYPNFGNNNSWELNPSQIEKAEIYFPAIAAQRNTNRKNPLSPDLQYWTPTGHNAWVGDVATLYHNQRYHVFYLYDRRHHASKFGVGGHYFEHFSTTDFRTWTEHEAAVPIQQQWETIGTGTPFVYNEQLTIAYGLHTSRIFPDEQTATIEQKNYYEQHKKTGSFPFDLSKNYPSGATYSVSQNGISDFKKSNTLFHYCENPSVYIDPNGKLKMIANFRAKGMWASETLEGGWYSVNDEFPPGGDCTFFFRWGKFDYIIGGFVNLWNKPANAGEDNWTDLVKKGQDFYNGINVPAITEIKDGRFLMAGWFPIRNGWGGPFVIHELIQFPDGRIGTKWMKELEPVVTNTMMLAKSVRSTTKFPVTDQAFLISFDVYPSKKTTGKLGINFLPATGEENGCQFQIHGGNQTAQFSNTGTAQFAAPESSLRQEGSPHQVGNYAIEQLTGINKPYSVRLLVKTNAKLGGSIIDAEIAGQRTMISYRQDLVVENLQFQVLDTEIRNLRLMKIVNE